MDSVKKNKKIGPVQLVYVLINLFRFTTEVTHSLAVFWVSENELIPIMLYRKKIGENLDYFFQNSDKIHELLECFYWSILQSSTKFDL